MVPDQHEVAAFFKANGSTGPEAGRFWNFYASKGWMVGKSKMVDWRASARNWISGRFIDGGRPSSQQPSQPYGNPALLPEDLDRMMAEARGER